MPLILFAIIVSHNDFFPNDEQPEQRILAPKLQQPTAGCTAILHKYCCYVKRGDITRTLTTKLLRVFY